MRVIEEKGKKNIILVPEDSTEQKFVDSMTEESLKSFVVRKAKFTPYPYEGKNSLILKDSRRIVDKDGTLIAEIDPEKEVTNNQKSNP